MEQSSKKPYSSTPQKLNQDLGLFTPGNLMCFLWSDSYPIVKRPGVNALWNTFEMDINTIAQTTSGGGLGHILDKTSVHASGCWNHICKYYSSQNVKK